MTIDNDFDLTVIGIPSWPWKKKMLKYALSHPRIIEIPTKEKLCFECSRHFELLTKFDNNSSDYKNSEYWEFCSNNKKKRKGKDIVKKINRFFELYNITKERGYVDPPVITEDGCRLDGSHRMAMAIHLNFESIKVNLAKYGDLFSSKESKSIKWDNWEYRKKVYSI